MTHHEEVAAVMAENGELKSERTANNELYAIAQSDLAAVSLQYDAATAVMARLEAAARHDAEEIARLGAELAQTTSALNSYSDALTQLIGWAEDGSPEDGYLYALTEAKKVLKDFKVVGSEVERLRAELAAAKRELNDAEEARNDAETRLLASLTAARQDAEEIAAKERERKFQNYRADSAEAGWAKDRELLKQDTEEIARLREALEFYADPLTKMDPHPIPDFYYELDFGECARAALASLSQGEVRVQAHGPFPGAPFSPPKGDK